MLQQPDKHMPTYDILTISIVVPYLVEYFHLRLYLLWHFVLGSINIHTCCVLFGLDDLVANVAQGHFTGTNLEQHW